MDCPVCGGTCSVALIRDGCPYLECSRCRFLFHRKDTTSPGESTLDFYNQRYWEMEQAEARRREQQDCFVRALELVYISGIPVLNILDFGCGLGNTVQLLRDRLGLNAVGVDLSAGFEPADYLHRCELAKLLNRYPSEFFDAIYSVEVFEHLEDPKSILHLLKSLLKPGGRILINTATREYIAKYDPELSYVDPVHRGHISIYSLETLQQLASGIGYSAEFLGDRRYAVVLSPTGHDLRFPNPDNMDRIRQLGEWQSILFPEYMRLVQVEKEFEKKSAWVNQLVSEVETLLSERNRLIDQVDLLEQQLHGLEQEIQARHKWLKSVRARLTRRQQAG